MQPLSLPHPDPFEELTLALRQATPSVDERLLSPESLTVQAANIARELEKEFPGEGELLQSVRQLASSGTQKLSSASVALSQSNNEYRSLASRQEALARAFETCATQISSNLQAFNQDLSQGVVVAGVVVLEQKIVRHLNTITAEISANLETLTRVLNDLSESQLQIYHYQEERNQIFAIPVQVMQQQFDDYGEILRQAIEKRPQRRRSAADITKEAHFFAETQKKQEILDKQRQSQLNQSRTVFFFALTLLSLGVLLVFAGIIGAFFFNILTAGAISALSGVVMDISSTVVFRFSKQENDRLDTITQELSILDRVTIAMQYISQISDDNSRNQAIGELARRLVPSSEPKKKRSKKEP